MTTLVVGNCGHAAAPVAMDMVDAYRAGAAIYEVDGYDWTWETMGEYLDTVREARTSVNVVALTGHLNVRHLAIGEANRPASPDERTMMRELVVGALADGARGFSTGLMYQHTVFSDTDEVVEMAKALAPYGWAYHTHIRDYGRHLQKAVAEAIEIAERAEVPLVVSHMYPAGREYWGQAGACIEMLEKARRPRTRSWLRRHALAEGRRAVHLLLPALGPRRGHGGDPRPSARPRDQRTHHRGHRGR